MRLVHYVLNFSNYYLAFFALEKNNRAGSFVCILFISRLTNDFDLIITIYRVQFFKDCSIEVDAFLVDPLDRDNVSSVDTDPN